MSYNFLYINPRRANCSIYQGGKMVYESIKDGGEHYTMQYVEANELDIAALHAGKIVMLRDGNELPPFDGYIFNYHDLTMRDYERIQSEYFANLPGLKYAVIFEMLPGNPIIRTLDISVNHGDFNGYLVVDPTLQFDNPLFHAFPRPITNVEVEPYVEQPIPVIGSFGFAGPWKGFPDLVRAVNDEFDRAIIRFNFPPSTYFGDAGGVLNNDIAYECVRLAKPGVEVRLTHDYMSDDELIKWLSQNTLNAFFYTRDMPGLCAATDQAIMSGRPLAVSTNKSFRHIHPYQAPYPQMSLKDTIANGADNVKKMQEAWNYKQCQKRFMEIVFDND